MASNLKFLILVISTGLLLISCTAEEKATEAAALTQQQGDAILEELKGIRQLLKGIEKKIAIAPTAQKKAPSTATLDISDERPTLGSGNAPVTIVEFTDYQCPFCRRFAHSTFPMIKRDFIETGKVRWQVRDLPLNFHNHARKAAQAVLCARDQGKFWQLRDSLFINSANLEIEKIKSYANELKVDMPVFNTCLDSGKYLDIIDKDIASAKQMRITGTPTFLLGHTEPGKLTGKLIIGAQSPAVFSAAINKLLNK